MKIVKEENESGNSGGVKGDKTSEHHKRFNAETDGSD